jgi:hypothetical protein
MSIEEKRQRITKLAREYSEQVGLGTIYNKNEINKYLNLSIEEKRKLTAEECGEAAITLSQGAIYIQKEVNILQTDLNWCEKYIDFTIANEVLNLSTQYIPYENKKTVAIKNNDVAMQLQKIINDINARITSVQYIPKQLHELARAYSELQQTKRFLK